MRIGIVEQHSYPKDRLRRVIKIIKTLEQAGHSVVVMSRNESQKLTAECLSSRVKVYRLGSGSTTAKVLSYPAPLNLLWTWWIHKTIRQEKLDLLIVTGLRLVLPTVLASKLAKIPVMFDMVEYFPGISQSQKLSQFKRHLKNIISTVFEFIAVKKVDFVCVVVEEQRQRLLELGVPASNISVVSNTPFLSDKNTSQWDDRMALHPDQEFYLTYAGLALPDRGLDLIIKALPHIKASQNVPPLVKFVIVGDGEEAPYLRELANQLDVKDQVEFVGWVAPQEIPAILKKSHVGVIPHIVSDFWNHTIPNKLFDYMLQGIPVLSTQAHPIERIVNQEQCGVIVPEEPLEVAKTILRLKEDQALLQAMGRRGRQAVLKKYNWTQDSSIFLRTLDDVMERRQ